MPLTCYCDFDEDCAWYYEQPNDYSTLGTKRRRRCSSCKELIDKGAVVAKFHIWRHPNSEVEIKIYEEEGEVYMANKYLCESCSDLWFSFLELGFECVDPTENMRALAKEYAAAYGPAK